MVKRGKVKARTPKPRSRKGQLGAVAQADQEEAERIRDLGGQ